MFFAQHSLPTSFLTIKVSDSAHQHLQNCPRHVAMYTIMTSLAACILHMTVYFNITHTSTKDEYANVILY